MMVDDLKLTSELKACLSPLPQNDKAFSDLNTALSTIFEPYITKKKNWSPRALCAYLSIVRSKTDALPGDVLDCSDSEKAYIQELSVCHSTLSYGPFSNYVKKLTSKLSSARAQGLWDDTIKGTYGYVEMVNRLMEGGVTNRHDNELNHVTQILSAIRYMRKYSQSALPALDWGWKHFHSQSLFHWYENLRTSIPFLEALSQEIEFMLQPSNRIKYDIFKTFIDSSIPQGKEIVFLSYPLLWPLKNISDFSRLHEYYLQKKTEIDLNLKEGVVNQLLAMYTNYTAQNPSLKFYTRATSHEIAALNFPGL